MKAITYLTEGFETVEALAVVDILRRAGVETETVSVTGSPEVKSAQDITVTADRGYNSLDTGAETADLLFLPGGPGSFSGLFPYEKIDGLKDIFIKQHENGGVIAAICAAPSVLGKWGLLKGKNATCFPGFEKDLQGAKVQRAPARVVTDGNVITSRGMGTAIDLGLAIVEKLLGEEKAAQLGADIQYLDE